MLTLTGLEYEITKTLSKINATFRDAEGLYISVI